jgi:transposase-like protein
VCVAVQRREQGNACYRSGAWRRAFNRYVLAAAAVAQAGRDHSFDAAQRARARQEQLRVGLNVAAVALQLGDGETALVQCAEALVLDPSLLKGWWRQGKARLLLGDAEGAVSDLTRAEQLVGRPVPPAPPRHPLQFVISTGIFPVPSSIHGIEGANGPIGSVPRSGWRRCRWQP